MNDKDAKKLERLTERYKKNNEKIKQNYDRVSIALPKGTKDRIKATGDTLNNFIINAVMEKLKAAEADLQQAAQETPGGPEEGTTAGSPDTARREPVEDPETCTKGTDAPQPINPGDNLQNMLLYPYGMDDDIPPEELPFH